MDGPPVRPSGFCHETDCCTGRASLRLDRSVEAGALGGNGLTVDAEHPRLVKAEMRDVAAELPPLLARIRQAGGSVEDVDVRGPSLQAVFIHLTGRELRE